MPTFYLVRHGEKIRIPGDPGLSESGKEQARKTAKHLQKFPITRIVTSPYNRTKETAQLISDILKIPFTQHESLKERMNWEGTNNQSYEEFINEWEYATAHPEFSPQSGRSVQNTGHEIILLLKELDKNAENDHIVLVTHGGTIRDFLTILSQENEEIFSARKMEGIRECSITRVVTRRGYIFVEFFDNIDHLI